MNRSKAAVVVSKVISVIQMVLGIFCILLGGIGGWGVMEEGPLDGLDIFLIVFFVGGGIWLVAASVRRGRLLKRFRQYSAILSGNDGGFISDLAVTAGASESTVLFNLQKMIDKRYFTNAYIDLQERRIVFADRIQPAPAGERIAATPEPAGEAASQLVSVICVSCGGLNHIEKGRAGECEYCGSPLRGE